MNTLLYQRQNKQLFLEVISTIAVFAVCIIDIIWSVDASNAYTAPSEYDSYTNDRNAAFLFGIGCPLLAFIINFCIIMYVVCTTGPRDVIYNRIGCCIYSDEYDNVATLIYYFTWFKITFFGASVGFLSAEETAYVDWVSDFFTVQYPPLRLVAFVWFHIIAVLCLIVLYVALTFVWVYIYNMINRFTKWCHRTCCCNIQCNKKCSIGCISCGDAV